MLKYLEYSNTFPTTGRTLAGKIDFQQGFGSITGPNESGKSFVLEMIRYALFGTAALRGLATDYKKLLVSLTFVVRGDTYNVNRKNTGATLLKGTHPVAVGVKPVNEKIISLLGFGLQVFDMACVANQGDLEELGKMRPSDRKRMVDSVIGLGVIEDLGKWANEKALEHLREAQIIEKVTIAPVIPEDPLLPSSAEIRQALSDLKLVKTEYDQLDSFLRVKKSVPQRDPERVALPSEHLLEFVTKQDQLKARLNAIVIPPNPPRYSEVELEQMLHKHDAADKWTQYEWQLKEHPRADYTKEQLDQFSTDWDTIAAFDQNELLKKELEHALSHGHNECPNCQYTWPVAAEQVDNIRKLLASEPSTRPPSPPVSRDALALQYQRLNDDFVFTPAEKVARPHLSRGEIGKMQADWGRQGDGASLLAERDSITNQLAQMPDYRAMYNERIKWEAGQKRFLQDLQEYSEWETRYAEATKRMEELSPKLHQIPVLEAQLTAAVTYETQLDAYSAAMVVYADNMTKVEALKTEGEEWKKAKNALVTLRLLVKQHLLPSLNKVASTLIRAMTGAQRQSIVVDDEFEVTVDGQALNTLSGSGKAVANLALRLGLGQVLTNNVFSVFMGDEIDASMDKDRAENTALTLQSLRNRISQILLVTHKFPQADYYIELGKHENTTTDSGRTLQGGVS